MQVFLLSPSIFFSSASFIKANSLSESHHTSESNNSMKRDSTDADIFGPLGNVRYLLPVSINFIVIVMKCRQF